MSRNKIINFSYKVKTIQEQFEQGLKNIEKDMARKNGVPVNHVQGKARDYIYEADVRKYLVDPILDELGWETSGTSKMVIEDPVEECPAEDSNRKFLDYHGRIVYDGGKDKSLAIIETKWSRAKLPWDIKKEIPDVIAKEIVSIQKGQTPAGNITTKWREWLETLIKYTKRVEHEMDAPTKRVVITNGEWFIFFVNPQDTLLSKSPSEAGIEIFNDLDEVMRRRERFWQLLSYQELSGHVPPQHPSALSNFVKSGEQVSCWFVAKIEYKTHGARQPLISIGIYANVITPRGALIRFEKKYSDQHIVLSTTPNRLKGDCDNINSRADDLLGELRLSCDVQVLPAKNVEDYLRRENGEVSNEESILCKKDKNNFYHLILGDCGIHRRLGNKYINCPSHNFTKCLASGNPAGKNEISKPEISPRAFFVSGKQFHCADIRVHNKRENHCAILEFEEYFCCQQCSLFSRCWPDEGACLPCCKN